MLLTIISEIKTLEVYAGNKDEIIEFSELVKLYTTTNLNINDVIGFGDNLEIPYYILQLTLNDGVVETYKISENKEYSTIKVEKVEVIVN